MTTIQSGLDSSFRNQFENLKEENEVLKDSLSCEQSRVAALRDEQESNAEEISRLEAILGCRAGRLLEAGEEFLVVKESEPYFALVYNLIRSNEQAKGTWTPECEEAYQSHCHDQAVVMEAIDSIPVDTLRMELQASMAELAKLRAYRDHHEFVLGQFNSMLKAICEYAKPCARKQEQVS